MPQEAAAAAAAEAAAAAHEARAAAEAAAGSRGGAPAKKGPKKAQRLSVALSYNPEEAESTLPSPRPFFSRLRPLLIILYKFVAILSLVTLL